MNNCIRNWPLKIMPKFWGKNASCSFSSSSLSSSCTPLFFPQNIGMILRGQFLMQLFIVCSSESQNPEFYRKRGSENHKNHLETHKKPLIFGKNSSNIKKKNHEVWGIANILNFIGRQSRVLASVDFPSRLECETVVH